MTPLGPRRWLAILAVAIALSGAACQGPPASSAVTVSPGAASAVAPETRCGPYVRPECETFVALALEALAPSRADPPVLVAVDRACPPNARCVPSSLGGDTAAVIVRWADGAVAWTQIPLPADWPTGQPGAAMPMAEPPPEHLRALVAAG